MLPQAEIEVRELQAKILLASHLLRSMGSPRRLGILCQLIDGEKTVGQLADLSGLSQSALSQHLALLRKENVVQTRRVTQSIFYSLAGPEVRAILGTLYNIYCKAESDQTRGVALP